MPSAKKRGLKADPIVPSARNIAVAKVIGETLDALYPDPPIPLNHVDSYTLLVAVILSAQTTDGKVNEVTPQLFLEAPTPTKLAAMKYEHLHELIRTVGLAPTKAKNLLKCGQRLVDEFNGVVPSSYSELESLAGVGHKTASCVMSQAFGEASFPVDTHIHRVAKRWGLVSETANVEAVEEKFKALFPSEKWAALHLQLIYFGREWCQKKNHAPAACPICSICSKSSGPYTAYSAEVLAKHFSAPKKASKNSILYSERHAELAEFGQRALPKAGPSVWTPEKAAALIKREETDGCASPGMKATATRKRPCSSEPAEAEATLQKPRRTCRRL
jgi:endonuclease-3